MTLQDSIDRWAFHYTNTINTNLSSNHVCSSFPSLVEVPYPTAQYDANPFYTQVGSLLGLALAS